MKLLSVVQARSVLLFDMREANPRGGSMLPLYAGLLERYRFLNAPDLRSVLRSNEAIKLASGSFQVDAADPRSHIEVNVEVYRDGLVSESRSDTRDTDFFLQDLTDWAEEEFGLKVPTTAKSLHFSALLVETPDPFRGIGERLRKEFAAAALIKPSMTARATLSPSSMSFALDPNDDAGGTPRLVFERENGAPISSNRFFTSAPLHTEVHLELVADMVECLRAMPSA